MLLWRLALKGALSITDIKTGINVVGRFSLLSQGSFKHGHELKIRLCLKIALQPFRDRTEHGLDLEVSVKSRNYPVRI